MSHFIPGKIVKTFTTKKGTEITIRYPKWEDLDEMTRYINEISKENTFLLFSGEEITKEGEADFLGLMLKGIEFRNKVFLGCFVNETLIGVCSVERLEHMRERCKHIATFGLSLASPFRGEGIGYEFAYMTVEEAKKNISGMKLITLEVFGNNEIAQNLYRKLGFIECGRIPKAILHRGDYVDEIKMYLEVNCKL